MTCKYRHFRPVWKGDLPFQLCTPLQQGTQVLVKASSTFSDRNENILLFK